MNQGPFPREILILIFKHIPPGTIAKWRLVSRRWRDIITNEKWYGNSYSDFRFKMMTRYVPEVRIQFAQGILNIHHLVMFWIFDKKAKHQYEFIINNEKLIDLNFLLYNHYMGWYDELCTSRGYKVLKKGYITIRTCVDYNWVAFRNIRTNDKLWNEFEKYGMLFID